MKKIKNKIIKMLGGIPLEEHIKDKEIAILNGKKDVCLSINIYMKDYVLNPDTDNSDLAFKTHEYVQSIKEEAQSKLINLIAK